MRKKIALLVALVFIILLPKNLYAWGKKGHGIVAEIAFSLLDSNTRAVVQGYLGTTTIEEASTWMDEMRSDHKYDYMKPWHYVNIDKGNQYAETKDENIVNALNNTIYQLKHRDALRNDEVKKYIMILFHLTGDFHMPLHVGYGVDKGGNDIHVKYLNRQANLHSVWDTEIIESEGITTRECLFLYSHFDKAEITSFKTMDIERWIFEPRSLLGNVYDFTDNKIDEAYIAKNKPIIKQQLLIAGIRLAAVLETLFRS